MNTVLLHSKKDNLGSILKTYREKVGFTQASVAKKAGISVSMLSQIERSAVSPSIDTLFKVCDALGVDIPHLFKTLTSDKHVRITHEGQRTTNLKDGVQYEQLAISGHSLYPVEMFMLTLAPEQSAGLTRRGHEGVEIGYVLKGTAQLIINEKEYKLKKGDSVTFHSSFPHRIKNCGDGEFCAIWNAMPPRMM